VLGGDGYAEHLRVVGEHEVATRDVLLSMVAASETDADVIVDASGISFIDCTGLAALVAVAERVPAFERGRAGPRQGGLRAPRRRLR
jgi:ABC-type transporter Mla MlaB component